ncbi:MAG: ATP-binding protein [Chloroflexota bacterium]|nr:ATP-binding protein [Chloroflexota bacterium]
MKDEDKTREQLVREVAELRQKVTELSVLEADKWVEEEIDHLNRVLRAIRNVNQLIVRERDRDHLLQGVCDILIETRGYYNAWIALLDEAGGLVAAVEAGVGAEFLPLVEQMKRGELPECGRMALAQPGMLIVEDPFSVCADCSLSPHCAGRGGVTVRLEYQGQVYGLMSVSVSREFIANKEEQSLFEEVAGDIAFALHGIELEKGQKQAEKALDFERRQLLSIFDSIDEAVYVSDPDTYEVLYVNRATRNLFGDVIGQKCHWAFQHLDSPCPFCTNERIFGENAGQPYIWEFQNTINRRWYRCIDRAIRWPDGRMARYEMAIDITDLKQAEEGLKEYSERLEGMVEQRTRELQDAHEQLVRREKLAVLGQLAGGVGHELRNPLGAIKNAAYFLNMVIEEPEPEVKETLEILTQEVGTSERIISSLLDFARTRPPTRRKVDVNAVLQKALSRAPVPQNVQVVAQLDETLPAILADPDQLGQIFGNVILNGIQAMPEGGRLIIETLEISGKLPQSGWVAVSFTDTGVGIPEENLGKLFEPLFTTKAKGIGLGLPVVKTLVEGHEGTIGVESDVGQGSTFTISLPLAGPGAGDQGQGKEMAHNG